MRLLPESAYDIQLPRMYRVRQKLPDFQLADVEQTVKEEMDKPEIATLIQPGMHVALLVGSRGIQNLQLIVKTIGACMIERGALPFVVPAMGSHGGTASAQLAILEAYGISAANMGFPIKSGMEVDEIGCTASGVPVCIDRIAHGADMIVPINRVKPHTDFTGPIESGLCKMLTIGLGNHEGASRLHGKGFACFRSLIPEAAQLVMDRLPVGFGVAILENGYDQTFGVEVVAAQDILSREPVLLQAARANMAQIMLDEIDVLIVQQMGKDISGAGMDPNIIGRTTEGPKENHTGVKIQRIVVEDLTPASCGNAAGIGLADFVLEQCVHKIDRDVTAINCVSSVHPEAARLPVVVSNEREGVLCGLKTAVDVDFAAPKIVKIKDTLDLAEILVSEALLPEIERNEHMEIVEQVNLFI